ERELKRAWMIAKSPSKRIRTFSATSPLIVTGCAVSLRNSALSSSEPSGVDIMKSSAKISSKRFTSPFCTDAVKSTFRAVSVSRSRCAFAFVCMALSSGARVFELSHEMKPLSSIRRVQHGLGFRDTGHDPSPRRLELRPSFLKHPVSADVHPIVLLGWHVTQLAVGL